MVNGGVADGGSDAESTKPAVGPAAGRVDQPGRVGGVPLEASTAARVRIRVLGPPTIYGVPVGHHVRPQALEFLAYLTVRRGPLWQNEILDDLMPEPPRVKAAHRLHTYTYNYGN